MAESLRDESMSPSPEHQSGLPSLTHHCILHAVEGIAPHGINTVLPQSGSHNITSFCKELAQLVRDCSGEKLLPILAENELVPPITIQDFYSDVMSEAEFARQIEKALVEATCAFGIELESLHKLCWQYYREAKKSEVSFPKWLTSTCTFRLWLIFNQCLDNDGMCQMTMETMNEILRRLIEMCSYTWDDTYCVGGKEEGEVEGRVSYTFPQFLDFITECFERFELNTSLTAEVIADLLDETVHGVLKKGFLEKKGHVRRNWRRRWFILKRTILTYYSTDKKILKGQLVLNSQTKVISLPDKGNRRYMFLVTCGVTEKPFTISADDQKMKHEWMLAIKKAIALAQLAEGDAKSQAEERKQLEEALSGFFLLKYGTDHPHLRRQDSDILHMKPHTTRRKFRTIQRMTKISHSEAPPTDHTPQTEVEQEQYVEMKGSQEYLNNISSESDEDEYCRMEPVNVTSCSSSEGGQNTPHNADDSILNFSLPLSGVKDDIFNLESPSSRDDGMREGSTTNEKKQTGLGDSFYEQCGSETARYIPEERYVDVKHNDKHLEESESPPKAVPTQLNSDPSAPTEEYLTILPSPKATPSPEHIPSPVHNKGLAVAGPPVPPRKSGVSPLPPLKRTALGVSPSLPFIPGPVVGPVPPARKGLSSFSSPPHDVHTKWSPPSSSVPTGRGNELSETADGREDVTRLLKQSLSSGEVMSRSGARKPIPPPRVH